MKLDQKAKENRKGKIPVIAKNLVKNYRDFRAVNGVSFEVTNGECVALLGPNGAGKTTLIKMISCIFPPTSGELYVFHKDISKHAREIKRIIGVVPQENSLDMDLTVTQNLLVYASYFSIPKREARERAEKLLEEFGLSKFRDWKISHLSGGLKRRLTVARAFINSPRLLILDEPTTGLDPQSRGFIWEKLEHFKRNGTTMLLTTHYIEEAQKFADRVIIVDHGRVLATGEPAELIKRHAGTHVIELANRDGKTSLYQDVKLAIDDYVESTTYHTYIFTNSPDRVLGVVKKRGIEDYRVRPATLEDVFIRLTGRELRE